jgi:signal transduction histidine kinase
LSNQLREFEAISGLPTRLQVEGSEESLNGDRRHVRKIAQMRVAIFRITQEALTNAYKHAAATQIQVRLHYHPHRVEVAISDNGRGMNSAAHSFDLSTVGQQERIYSGRGMQGMRERVEELGGTLEVTQATIGGVCVRACIPT